VFGDCHLGVYEGSIIDDNGLNGRLVDGLKVWDGIEEYALENHIETIVFLGDRFRSTNPKGYIRDLADEKLKRFIDKFKFISIVGNHDYYEKSSVYHSYGIKNIFVKELDSFILFDKPGSVSFEGVRFWGLPFGSNCGEFNFENWNEGDYNILLFHDALDHFSAHPGHSHL